MAAAGLLLAAPAAALLFATDPVLAGGVGLGTVAVWLTARHWN